MKERKLYKCVLTCFVTCLYRRNKFFILYNYCVLIVAYIRAQKNTNYRFNSVSIEIERYRGGIEIGNCLFFNYLNFGEPFD